MTTPAAPAVLGVDLGGTKIAVAVGDPDGTVLDTVTVPTEAAEGADAVVARTCATARDLLGRLGRRAVAVAAVTPGVPTPTRIHLAPNIPGWSDVALAPRLRHGLGPAVSPTASVVVDNDVKAGALQEARAGGLAGSRTGLYLNLGTGISSAVVVDGTVLHGAHGAAGEIAYQLRTPDDLAGAAPHLDRAPLEELVGGRAVDAAATRRRGVFTRATDALRSDEESLLDAVEPALAALETAVVNICCLLDPDVVVLAGGLVNAADVIIARLQRAVRAAVPFPPVVRPAARPFDAPLYGAVLLATSALRADPTVHPTPHTGAGLEETA